MKPWRQDDGPHIKCLCLRFVLELDGTGRTEFFTGLALALGKVDAVFLVNGVFLGHCLGIGHIDCLTLDKVNIVFVIDFLRAFFGTGATADALLYVYEPGVLQYFYFEASRFSFDINDFGKGQ